MTKEQLSKLEALAIARGTTVEALRKQFSEMGRKSPRTGSFKSSEEARAAQKLSTEAKKRKRDELE